MTDSIQSTATFLPPKRRRRLGRPAWQEDSTIVGKIAKAIGIAIILLLVLFPFSVVISTSLSTQESLAAAGGYVIWPTEFSLAAYERVLTGSVIMRSMLVSVFITAVGTAISLTATFLAAYGLSRPGTLMHRPLLLFILFTFLFTPGIIPLYLMVRQLGMLDTYWALILPTAINVFNFVIVRGFIQGIPQELIDAARIDGAGEWRILWTIVTPLSRGVLAVVGLFYGVGYWNAYFNAVLYLNDTEKWPLQLIIRAFVLQGQSDFNNSTDLLPPPQEALQMALLVVSIIPILVVYPFLQRHLKKGVLTGAVKG